MRVAGKKEPIHLPVEYSKYTMLVAWHKFDKRERWVLAAITGLEIGKLPFAPIFKVWGDIEKIEFVHSYTIKHRMEEPTVPCKEYKKRILRAAMKEHRKHHRKRLRIKT